MSNKNGTGKEGRGPGLCAAGLYVYVKVSRGHSNGDVEQAS